MLAEQPVEVLVVDDRADQRMALAAVLADLPVRVVEASSGREALRCLLQRDFALILLDIDMPGIDGLETAALIRERKRSEHTPIIFVTAYGDDTHVARSYSLGAVDYMLTPFDPQVLRTKVAVFVDLFRKSEEIERHAQTMRHHATQLRRLVDASAAIHAARNLDDLLELVVDTAATLIESDEAAIEVSIQPAAGAAPDAPALRVHCRPAESRLPSLGLSALLAVGGRVARLSRAELEHHPAWSELAALGARLPGSWLAAPLVSNDGRKFGSLQLCRRDGEFAAADEALFSQLAQVAAIAVENRLYSEAQAANRAKDQFLATLSHELRTPLQAILSWIHILREEVVDPQLLGRGLEVIERSANAQRKLIDDLLDVSRIITNKLRLEKQTVLLPKVIEGAVEAARPAAEAGGIRLRSSVGSRDLPVLGDPNRLHQVMGNLLSNAIKFTPRGGRVEISLRQSGDHAEIAVTDSGKGIDPSFLPQIFERFLQADSSSTRSHAGLGIGLAIVRHLVSLHGGSVRAESDGADRGARFVVTLPIGSEGREETQAPEPRVPAKRRQAHVVGLRVLLVDDEDDAREGVATMLRMRGADVTAVASAAAALAFLERQTPDILVSDLAMPVQDGYSLVRSLRALEAGRGGARTPALALSAYARSTESAQALEAGFDLHLAKPVDEPSLLEAIALVRSDEGMDG